jgi:hypothetical protein
MMPSRTQIWERSRFDLAGNPLNGKEDAKDRLFPVEVEGVGSGKDRCDLSSQLGPASGGRPSGEAARHRVRFRTGPAFGIPAGRADGDALNLDRKQMILGAFFAIERIAR